MTPNKSALICGISGQDGSYLARLLLGKGYVVWGTSRDAQGSTFENLKRLGIYDQVNLLSMISEDFRSVLAAIEKSSPIEVYSLSCQSSVSLSFELPSETIQSVVLGTLNLLEACRMIDKEIRFYSAGSSECFGNTNGNPANEKTPFNPQSPYAIAKLSAFWLVKNYREAYGLYACTGLLFNHESPLRPVRYVMQKIVHTARRISSGSAEKLFLGRMDIRRDWGWAPEYVDAMWRMLQLDKPDDFVIATGKSHSLEEVVAQVFAVLKLNWRDHVVQDKSLFRPTDLLVSVGDPRKANEELNWQAQVAISSVLERMLAETNL